MRTEKEPIMAAPNACHLITDIDALLQHCAQHNARVLPLLTAMEHTSELGSALLLVSVQAFCTSEEVGKEMWYLLAFKYRLSY